MLFSFSLTIILIAFGASLPLGRSSFPIISSEKISKFYRYLFYLSIIGIVLIIAFKSYKQYLLWAGQELTRFFLPPYSYTYFIGYVGTRFFAPYVISLATSILFLLTVQKTNRRYNERFFYPEELYFGAISIFLAGHPGWLIYLILAILVYLMMHLYSLFMIRDSSTRISTYYLWLPTAIFAIILERSLENLPFWQTLII